MSTLRDPVQLGHYPGGSVDHAIRKVNGTSWCGLMGLFTLTGETTETHHVTCKRCNAALDKEPRYVHRPAYTVIVEATDTGVRTRQGTDSFDVLGFDHHSPVGAGQELAHLIVMAAQWVADGHTLTVEAPSGTYTVAPDTEALDMIAAHLQTHGDNAALQLIRQTVASTGRKVAA